MIVAKGGTTDPQFNLVIYARNLPEKLHFNGFSGWRIGV